MRMAFSPRSMRRVQAQESSRVRKASQSAQVGTITGFYFDGTYAVHGFLRDTKGVITTFDLPGGGTGPFEGTYGGGFTPDGGILGVLIDANFVNHGFLLDKHGAVTIFDAPHGGTGFNQGTLPWDINDEWSDHWMVR